MTTNFRTIAFPDPSEHEMLRFVDKHWDRVIEVYYQPEYNHPGGYDAFVVKLKPPVADKTPAIGDILNCGK